MVVFSSSKRALWELVSTDSSQQRYVPEPLYSVVLVSSLVAASLLFCSCLDPHRLPSQTQVLLRHPSAHLRCLRCHRDSHLDLDNWARHLGEPLAVAVDADMDWPGKREYSLDGHCCSSCEFVLGRLVQSRGLVR